MSAVVFNIVIGLATSVLSGGSVWAWRRGAIATSVHRKAAFLGLAPGSCARSGRRSRETFLDHQ